MELYKLYYNREQVEAVGAVLGEAGIAYEIIGTRKSFDPSYAFNSVDPDINLMLRAEDFSRANEVLKGYYAKQAETVDANYYLFHFSDKELLDIIRKQDEWGAFDVALAKQILQDRGIPISEEADAISTRQRVAELAQPEAAPLWMFVLGYLSALVGGFVGFIIGWFLSATKVLPNGERVPIYKPTDRVHGRIIMTMGAILFMTYILIGMRRSLG
ncbi:MAG: hypothetical protein ACK5OP_15490 [Sphingobacteriales bacterium]